MLFGRKDKDAGGTPSIPSGLRPITPTRAFCRVCDDHRQFTKCWQRTGVVRQCTCCGLVFENPAALYAKFQPACPRCAEFLEQPEFIYGLCDGCGSKFELMPGSKPGLLPNKQQRDQMNKHGKARSID